MTLAIDGGAKVRTKPWPSRVQIDDREIKAVNDLMDKCRRGGAFDRYGGEEVDAYEKEFAKFFGVKYAAACSAGTAAVHTALGALELDPLSEVISAPITDNGAVMPIVWCGCIPIPADADPETMNMDPKSVEKRINRNTKAIIAGHIAGSPCDMGAIMRLSRKHGIPVIEDCSQSHAAEYKGKFCGAIGHLGVFSLMSGKHSTAGGQGGMVITNDEELYWKAKRFADRGKAFGIDKANGSVMLGLNYRMTELEAAIGRVQLKKIPTIVGNRRKVVDRIGRNIKGLKAVRLGKVVKGGRSAYWFLFIRVDESRLKVTKDQFARAVAAEGIPAAARYDAIPFHQDWMTKRATFGRSRWPWSLYKKNIDYTDMVPNAYRANDLHFRVNVHECYGAREADDMAEALAKVEKAYLK